MKARRLWGFTVLCTVVLLTVFIFNSPIVYTSSPVVEELDATQAKGVSQLETSYDLVVYGGEPEGVVAAISAARNGLKTLLVMEEDGPGGLIVYGGLNFLDLNYDSRSRIIHHGIFREWHNMVGNGAVVDIDEARLAFMKLLLEQENLTIVPVTRLKGYILADKDHRIAGLTFETTGISKTHDPELLKKGPQGANPAWNQAASSVTPLARVIQPAAGTIWSVRAERYIDASPDADLAARVGVPYFVGGADIGLPERRMAATLVFKVKNVDMPALIADVRSKRWGESKMNALAVWGLSKIGEQYKPTDAQTKLRGLNIARQDDGSVYINALLLFNIDPLDTESLQKGMERGKTEAARVVQYLRTTLGGFKKAELAGFPPQLYVRESRHVLALYQLDVLDLIEKVDFADKIAVGSYPIDYQAAGPDSPGYVVYSPGMYSIPFRSLIPRGKDNLLVVGRSAGYSSMAAASARVIPIGMATAEAAGMATALSIIDKVMFPKMAEDKDMIRVLQSSLDVADVNLPKIEGVSKITQNPDYPYLKELFDWGMLSAGYTNDLRLNEKITMREFIYLLIKGLKQCKAENYNPLLLNKLYANATNDPLDLYKASEILLTINGYETEKLDDAYLSALREGLIPPSVEKSWKTNHALTRGDIYRLAAPIFKRHPRSESITSLRSRPFGE